MNNKDDAINFYSNWLEIDQGAIAKNVQRLKEIAKRPVLAVVKGNGYGHGLCQAGHAAVAGGAGWLGVARIEEALWLRDDGITAPILVLGYCPPKRVPEAAAGEISLAIYDLTLAAAYEEMLGSTGQIVKIHAKFDTGMGRLGYAPEGGLAFLFDLQKFSHLQIEGMFTHFSCGDDPENPATSEQIRRFDALVKQCEGAGIRPGLIHACASAATLCFPEAHYDMVRCGIAIYGLQPSDEAPLPEGFEPALSWKTSLVSVKTVPPGHGVGYNRRYVTGGYERIGVIPVGYADGFRRRIGNFALVGGHRVQVVGGVPMDQCMLQLDDLPEAKIGDEVVLLGRQGSECITAEEIGKAWGTVNYDVVCGLAARVPRIYQNFPIE